MCVCVCMVSYLDQLSILIQQLHKNERTQMWDTSFKQFADVSENASPWGAMCLWHNNRVANYGPVKRPNNFVKSYRTSLSLSKLTSLMRIGSWPGKWFSDHDTALAESVIAVKQISNLLNWLRSSFRPTERRFGCRRHLRSLQSVDNFGDILAGSCRLLGFVLCLDQIAIGARAQFVITSDVSFNPLLTHSKSEL